MTAWSLKSSLESNFEIVGVGTTQLTAQLWDATHIGVTYKTLMGNQPQNFGNVVSVWSGSEIGWGHNPPPLVSVPVPDNTPSGDLVVTLGDQTPAGGPPYMVAYGTSNSGTAYCAGQMVDRVVQPPFTTLLNLGGVGNKSLLAIFNTPQGNTPMRYGNWIGLWAGQTFTYDGVNRIKKVTVGADVAVGGQAMNGLGLTIDSFYTLGYACGPRDQDLAAWITFKTQPFLLSRLLRALFPEKPRKPA